MPRSQFFSNKKAIQSAAVFLIGILTIFVLFWAKAVLIPLALSIMITFVLSPIVTRLQERGMTRLTAVVSVLMATTILFAGVILVVGFQLNALATDLPNYKENIKEKMAVVRRTGQGGAISKVLGVFKEASETSAPSTSDDVVNEKAPAKSLSDESQTAGTAASPIPVRVVPDAGLEKALSATLASLSAFSPALESLGTAGLVLILVVFMLLQREDLRNRLVSLMSSADLATTTKALNDAGRRISRYLFMQAIVNLAFGIAVGLGLMVIGVPYALLWGFCAAILRYIPYIGPVMASVLPVGVSLITSPAWTQVFIVLALLLTLELLVNNVMEPMLYGKGIGISMVALIVSAAFWTWIWGPMGLVLATPLTVCLVVIGKYVPAVAFLDRLLGDSQALDPHVTYLQRLLAKDDREAVAIVQQFRTERPPETVYDNLFIPALVMARKSRHRGTMGADEESFVLDTTHHILDEMGTELRVAAEGDAQISADCHTNTPLAIPRTEMSDLPLQNEASLRCKESQFEDGGAVQNTRKDGPHNPRTEVLRVLGCAAHHQSEELTLEMLAHLVQPANLQVEIVSTRTLPSEVVERVHRENPAAVVIAVLPPGGLVQARYLCKLLRKRFPELGILVGCWGCKGNLDKTVAKLRGAGANYMTTTLAGARDQVTSLAKSANLLANQSQFESSVRLDPQPLPATA